MIWYLFAAFLAAVLIFAVYCVPIGEALSAWLRVRALRAQGPALLREAERLRSALAASNCWLAETREALGARVDETAADAARRIVAERDALANGAVHRSDPCGPECWMHDGDDPACPLNKGGVSEGWTPCAGTGLGDSILFAWRETGSLGAGEVGCRNLFGLAWTARLPPAGWDGHRDVGVLPDGSPVVWGPVDRPTPVPPDSEGERAERLRVVRERVQERIGDVRSRSVVLVPLAEADRARRLAPLRAAFARAEARIDLYEPGAWPEDAARELAEARGAMYDAIGDALGEDFLAWLACQPVGAPLSAKEQERLAQAKDRLVTGIEYERRGAGGAPGYCDLDRRHQPEDRHSRKGIEWTEGDGGMVVR